MRRLLVPALMLLLLASCRRGTPADVLPPDKMVPILTDLQLVDAASRRHLMPETYDRSPDKYLLEVLAQHGTDTATFNQSMQWYVRHPDKLDKIYARVNEALMQTPQNP